MRRLSCYAAVVHEPSQATASPTDDAGFAAQFEELTCAGLPSADAYRLMTDLIAPRPIAWVATIDEQGRENLAPFSYYQAACSNPPTVVIAVSWHPDGRPKDTLANVLATQELCISHVARVDAEAMNATAVNLPHEVSEWDHVGVAKAPSRTIRPSRVASALAAFECRLVHALPLGRGSAPGVPSSTLVIAEIRHVVVRKGLLTRDARGRLLPMDPARLDPVGRMGGIAYTDATGRFELPRPEETKR